VPHAIGSLERPLSDDMIVEKFVRQSVPIIGEKRTLALIAKAWALETVSDVRDIALAGAA
jgi:hypothetical protein